MTRIPVRLPACLQGLATLSRIVRRHCIAAWLFACALAAALLVCGCADDASRVRIGTYDSRCVALAYWTGERLDAVHGEMIAARKTAEVAGDRPAVEQAEAEIWALRKQTHRQVFGTAPVDDVLEHIAEEIPTIVRDARVEQIVSKWDEQTLARYPSARLIDVTTPLVEAFHPSEKRMRNILSLRKHKPVSPEVLEKHLAEGGL